MSLTACSHRGSTHCACCCLPGPALAAHPDPLPGWAAHRRKRARHLAAAGASWTLQYGLWLAAAFLLHWCYWCEPAAACGRLRTARAELSCCSCRAAPPPCALSPTLDLWTRPLACLAAAGARTWCSSPPCSATATSA